MPHSMRHCQQTYTRSDWVASKHEGSPLAALILGISKKATSAALESAGGARPVCQHVTNAAHPCKRTAAAGAAT
ncbi:MAG: hypothetical protein ACQEXV_25215 [Bacillota bacterium]